jgi:hypothetical protein
MLCAVCVFVLTEGNGTDLTRVASKAAQATTQIRGTALCTKHAVEKLRRLPTLQELGVR